MNVALNHPILSGPRLWTLEDLEALPDELPTGPARYEIWDGELRLMAPPGDPHSSAQTGISARLFWAIQMAGLGRVRGELTLVVARDPDRILVPDVMAFDADSLPLRLTPQGYSETIPVLAVEVRGATDSAPEAERKAAAYLAAGVGTVWDLDPRRRELRVFRAGVAPVVLAEGESVELGAAFPGVSFSVRELLGE